jgi:dTMP kinase
MAFQTAKLKTDKEKKHFLEWLEELEFGIFNIPKPDMVIYLYAPHAVSQKMVDQKNKRNYTDKKRDIHERNSGFLAKVEKEYLNLAKTNPEWRTVICTQGDNLLPPDEISTMVFDVISGRLATKKPSSSTASLF